MYDIELYDHTKIHKDMWIIGKIEEITWELWNYDWFFKKIVGWYLVS